MRDGEHPVDPPDSLIGAFEAMVGPAPILLHPGGASAKQSGEDPGRRVDALLVERCRNGDESAWISIVDRFSSYVYVIAARFGLSEDRIEDVYQEVFTRAFVRLSSLREAGALKPWIAQLTRRAAIDRLRADAREPAALAAGDVSDADVDLEQVELAITVQRALDELPAPFGDVLRRFFIEDQSYRMIGAALGLPAGTVASRISRGLSMLREALDRAGASAEPVGALGTPVPDVSRTAQL